MKQGVCPHWVGYTLLSPLRKLLTNPDRILSPHVREGMTVLEPGPAMGFFSLPLARRVGGSGRVICVDVQESMIRSLEKRARAAGLGKRMDFRVCPQDTLAIDDLAGRIDFALAVYVVHEVPDARRFLGEIYASLKRGGTLLFSEPVWHVSRDHYAASLSVARAVGFEIRDVPKIRRSFSALLLKP